MLPSFLFNQTLGTMCKSLFYFYKSSQLSLRHQFSTQQLQAHHFIKKQLLAASSVGQTQAGIGGRDDGMAWA